MPAAPIADDSVLAAEVRAVLEGHQARAGLNEHGRFRFTVRSDSSDRSYTLWVYSIRGAIGVSCDCPAGGHRHGLIPCKHAARVCQRLEREGLAYRTEKGWAPAPQVLTAAWNAGSYFRPLDCCARCGKPIDPYADRSELEGVDFDNHRYHRRCSWVMGARRALQGGAW